MKQFNPESIRLKPVSAAFAVGLLILFGSAGKPEAISAESIDASTSTSRLENQLAESYIEGNLRIPSSNASSGENTIQMGETNPAANERVGVLAEELDIYPGAPDTSCTIWNFEISCCQNTTMLCLTSEWLPTTDSLQAPEPARTFLSRVTSSPTWTGEKTIYPRDFGYCARSLWHEYCFETDTEELTIYDWKLEADWSISLSNRQFFTEKFAIR